MDIYGFSDRLNDQPALRAAFVEEYVTVLRSDTSTADIVADWVRIMAQDLKDRIAKGETDNIVEQVATDYPELLRESFGVSV